MTLSKWISSKGVNCKFLWKFLCYSEGDDLFAISTLFRNCPKLLHQTQDIESIPLFHVFTSNH